MEPVGFVPSSFARRVIPGARLLIWMRGVFPIVFKIFFMMFLS